MRAYRWLCCLFDRHRLTVGTLHTGYDEWLVSYCVDCHGACRVLGEVVCPKVSS